MEEVSPDHIQLYTSRLIRPDANPEAILIGSPLDGTVNSKDSKVADEFEDVVGVVTNAFGFYRILPLTALNRTASASPALPPPTTITSGGTCKKLTVGSYNVENLKPTSAHLPSVARHMIEYLKTPDLIFLQEVQDNNGATNNGGKSFEADYLNLD